jgi:hypothetical protein
MVSGIESLPTKKLVGTMKLNNMNGVLKNVISYLTSRIANGLNQLCSEEVVSI